MGLSAGDLQVSTHDGVEERRAGLADAAANLVEGLAAGDGCSGLVALFRRTLARGTVEGEGLPGQHGHAVDGLGGKVNVGGAVGVARLFRGEGGHAAKAVHQFHLCHRSQHHLRGDVQRAAGHAAVQPGGDLVVDRVRIHPLSIRVVGEGEALRGHIEGVHPRVDGLAVDAQGNGIDDLPHGAVIIGGFRPQAHGLGGHILHRVKALLQGRDGGAVRQHIAAADGVGPQHHLLGVAVEGHHVRIDGPGLPVDAHAQVELPTGAAGHSAHGPGRLLAGHAAHMHAVNEYALVDAAGLERLPAGLQAVDAALVADDHAAVDEGKAAHLAQFQVHQLGRYEDHQRAGKGQADQRHGQPEPIVALLTALFRRVLLLTALGRNGLEIAVQGHLALLGALPHARLQLRRTSDGRLGLRRTIGLLRAHVLRLCVSRCAADTAAIGCLRHMSPPVFSIERQKR